MSNNDHNIDREITEGLARSEKMLHRQQMTNRLIILGSVLTVSCMFVFCVVFGLLILFGQYIGDINTQ